MSTDAKVEKYETLRLGYLPVVAVTIRHNIPPNGSANQSLTLELLRGEQTVSLMFTGLRELRLADLHPGSHCILKVLSVVQDQLEGIRYRVFNMAHFFANYPCRESHLGIFFMYKKGSNQASESYHRNAWTTASNPGNQWSEEGWKRLDWRRG